MSKFKERLKNLFNSSKGNYDLDKKEKFSLVRNSLTNNRKSNLNTITSESSEKLFQSKPQFTLITEYNKKKKKLITKKKTFSGIYKPVNNLMNNSKQNLLESLDNHNNWESFKSNKSNIPFSTPFYFIKSKIKSPFISENIQQNHNDTSQISNIIRSSLNTPIEKTKNDKKRTENEKNEGVFFKTNNNNIRIDIKDILSNNVKTKTKFLKSSKTQENNIYYTKKIPKGKKNISFFKKLNLLSDFIPTNSILWKNTHRSRQNELEEKYNNSRISKKLKKQMMFIENECIREGDSKNVLINKPPRLLNTQLHRFDSKDYRCSSPIIRAINCNKVKREFRKKPKILAERNSYKNNNNFSGIYSSNVFNSNNSTFNSGYINISSSNNKCGNNISSFGGSLSYYYNINTNPSLKESFNDSYINKNCIIQNYKSGYLETNPNIRLNYEINKFNFDFEFNGENDKENNIIINGIRRFEKIHTIKYPKSNKLNAKTNDKYFSKGTTFNYKGRVKKNENFCRRVERKRIEQNQNYPSFYCNCNTFNSTNDSYLSQFSISSGSVNKKKIFRFYD